MENSQNKALSRRKILQIGALSSGVLLSLQGLSQTASSLCGLKTPRQPEGPFYPVVDQADKDTDLTWVKGAAQKALGEVIVVQGIVQDQECKPVEGVLVEIWQACATGKYNHPNDPNPAELDPNFQYWGKAVTNNKGEYAFKTIIPGEYQADADWVRPPHIHFKIQKRGYMDLITQLYFAGNPLNEKDLILKRLKPDQQKEVVVQLLREQDKLPTANFNIKIEKP